MASGFPSRSPIWRGAARPTLKIMHACSRAAHDKPIQNVCPGTFPGYGNGWPCSSILPYFLRGLSRQKDRLHPATLPHGQPGGKKADPARSAAFIETGDGLAAPNRQARCPRPGSPARFRPSFEPLRPSFPAPFFGLADCPGPRAGADGTGHFHRQKRTAEGLTIQCIAARTGQSRAAMPSAFRSRDAGRCALRQE